MTILRCQELSKIYQAGEQPVYALNRVSLSLEQGSFTAIIGPSGSGKSTLLHLLSGLDAPSGGKVFYQDQDLYAYKDRQLAVLRRRRFGIVFQSYNLVRELTGYENILLPVMLDGRKPDEKYLNRVIDMLGVGDRLSHLPGAMSGGQQQRVSIARALAGDPAVILADEPTGALDSKSTDELLGLFSRLHADGQTILMVTHSVKAASHAGRVLFLKDGQVFHQLRRDGDTDARFYQRISDALTALTTGGDAQ